MYLKKRMKIHIKGVDYIQENASILDCAGIREYGYLIGKNAVVVKSGRERK